jgi:multiple sugar transport system permease protein
LTMRTRRILGMVLGYTVLTVSTLIVLFPIWVAVTTALKPMDEVMVFPPSFFPRNPTLSNIQRILNMKRFVRYLFNSFFVSAVTTLLSMVLATLGGYALSRFAFPGRRIFSQLILFVYMFPGVLLVIPLFLMLYSIGLVDTYASLILSFTTFSLPFCVWMLKGFFDSLPPELEDAGMVDGCSRLGVLRRIILPLSAPGLAAVAAFAFLLAWSEYLFSITFINSDAKRTLAAGMQTLVGQYSVDYGLLMAAAVVSIVPLMIFFLLLQKYIVEGMTAGAVKG